MVIVKDTDKSGLATLCLLSDRLSPSPSFHSTRLLKLKLVGDVAWLTTVARHLASA